MTGWESWNITWSWLRSCWKASSPRSVPGRSEHVGRAGAGADQDGHLTEDRDTEPFRDLVRGHEAAQRPGSEGGEHRCDEAERHGRDGHGDARVRRLRRELGRTEFRQHQERPGITVRDLHDPCRDGVGIGLSRGRIRARRTDRDGVGCGIAGRRNAHRSAESLRHLLARLVVDRAVLRLHRDLRDLDLNGADVGARVGGTRGGCATSTTDASYFFAGSDGVGPADEQAGEEGDEATTQLARTVRTTCLRSIPAPLRLISTATAECDRSPLSTQAGVRRYSRAPERQPAGRHRLRQPTRPSGVGVIIPGSTARTTSLARPAPPCPPASSLQLSSRGGRPIDVTQARRRPRLTPNKTANLYSSSSGSRNPVATSPSTTATMASAKAAVTGSRCLRQTRQPPTTEPEQAPGRR